MDTIGKRLKHFAEVAFPSISEFATAMGWKKSAAAYTYFTDTSEPGAPLLKKLNDYGCNASWLLFDQGEMFAENEAGRKLKDEYFKKVKVVGAISPEPDRDKNIRESIEASRVIDKGSFPTEAGEEILKRDYERAAATPQAPKGKKKK